MKMLVTSEFGPISIAVALSNWAWRGAVPRKWLKLGRTGEEDVGHRHSARSSWSFAYLDVDLEVDSEVIDWTAKGPANAATRSKSCEVYCEFLIRPWSTSVLSCLFYLLEKYVSREPTAYGDTRYALAIVVTMK